MIDESSRNMFAICDVLQPKLVSRFTILFLELLQYLLHTAAMVRHIPSLRLKLLRIYVPDICTQMTTTQQNVKAVIFLGKLDHFCRYTLDFKQTT